MAETNGRGTRTRRVVARYRLDPRLARTPPSCGFCGKSNHRRAKSCGRRACPGYIELWLGDQYVRLLENLLAYVGKLIWMPTITPPSMPWDTAYCAHRGPHKCSGPNGCRVDPALAAAWNRTADKRLSAMHKVAAQRTYRRFGVYPSRLGYVPELQTRGLIHWHVALGCGTPREVRAARFYVRQLHQLAPDYDYGHVDRKFAPGPTGQSAAYMSKYLTKGGTASLRELVETGHAPGRPVYVHRRLTSETRCTMRNLRRRRAAHVMFGLHLGLREVDRLWPFVTAFPGSRLLDEASALPQAVP